MRNRGQFVGVLLIVLMLLLAGCTQTSNGGVNPEHTSNEGTINNDMVLEEDAATVKIQDFLGNEVVVNKHPERVIVMQNSMLDLWYLAGGTAIARVSGTTSVPEEALDLPEVGKTTKPNVELLLSQEPELVILSGTTEAHRNIEDILTENNIPFIYMGLSIDCYENTMRTLYAFSKIIGDEEAFTNNISKIEKDTQAVLDKVVDQEAPSVVVLFASTKSVKCELENGLVGDMCKRLGAKNVVTDVPIEGATKVDFSLERIVEENPDYVLISTMGTLDKVKNRIKEDVEANEAWASLDAVKNGRVYYLPKDMFMYKPNARYPEAFEYLAKILYPEVFGE